MSQKTETVSGKKLWVLISATKETTKEEDLQRITPSIKGLIDEWQSKGKFIWSGPLNDNKTGIAIFEATEQEANSLYDNYDRNCSEVLDYNLYKWDALPFLSML